MKQFLKKESAFVLIIILCITSCIHKDNFSKINTKSLLTANTWRVVERAADDNNNGKIEENEFKQLSAREEITITFLKTGMGNEKIGKLYNSRFKWSLLDDENIIINFYVPNNSVDKWHITKLTPDGFNLLGTDFTNKCLYGFHCIAK